MKILMVASEVIPFAKTGGLADVTGALPKALTQLGHEVKLVMPRYKVIERRNLTLELTDLEALVGSKKISFAVLSTNLPGSKVKVYFIENNDLFERNGLYGEDGKDYPDNDERFIFFSKASLVLAEKLNWKPDIIHCHDWQTGLIPVYVKFFAENNLKFYENIKTVFTIHNLAYQGVFDKKTMEMTGLGWDYYTMDKLEFWGKVNFLKAALVFADLLTTVSEKYSKEIQGEEYGCGLQGLLAYRHKDLKGIINGIDYSVFDPKKDPNIFKNYSLSTLADKEKNKKGLQKEIGFVSRKKVPLFGIVSRLAEQKGLDIFSEILDSFLEQNVQLVILGTGDLFYHKKLAELEKKYPTKFKLLLKYDAVLAQKIYAGSDFFIMPSRFEPCGLGQLISLKYGTIPIVRETGGLADTIIDFDLAKDFESDRGNGFVFTGYSACELMVVIKRAMQVYNDEKALKKIRINAMKSDFSWKFSAKKYEQLFQDLLLKN